MHYDNDEIEKLLKGMGVKIVENCKIKTANGDETPFINSDRVTYADGEYTRQHPLPQWILIGDCCKNKTLWANAKSRSMHKMLLHQSSCLEMPKWSGL